MHLTLILLLLSPWLWWQSKYVRQNVPVLLEPTGLREGVEGGGRTLRLLLIGDSAAAGVGVEIQAEALSGQCVNALKSMFNCQWRLLAKTGHRTADICAMLAASGELACDVAIVSAGVNDVTQLTSPKQWVRDLDQLSQSLQQRGATLVLFTALPPMHRFTVLPQPLRWFLGQRALVFNRMLKRWCQGQPNVDLLVPSISIEENLLAADGFHPNAAAYTKWAQAAAERIRQHDQER